MTGALARLMGSIVSVAAGIAIYAIPLSLMTGWAFWIWMAIQLGSFGMFLFAILGPFAFVAAGLGFWSFLFGAPAWLLWLVL